MADKDDKREKAKVLLAGRLRELQAADFLTFEYVVHHLVESKSLAPCIVKLAKLIGPRRLRQDLRRPLQEDAGCRHPEGSAPHLEESAPQRSRSRRRNHPQHPRRRVHSALQVLVHGDAGARHLGTAGQRRSLHRAPRLRRRGRQARRRSGHGRRVGNHGRGSRGHRGGSRGRSRPRTARRQVAHRSTNPKEVPERASVQAFYQYCHPRPDRGSSFLDSRLRRNDRL